MLDTFKNSGVGRRVINGDDKFDAKVMNNINLYNYKCNNKDSKEYEVDKIIGKYIISHLDVFFNKPRKPKTLRSLPRGGRSKTKKRHTNSHGI